MCLVLTELPRSKLTAATREWILYTPDTVSQAFIDNDKTRPVETKRRHAIEDRDDLKKEVQVLEMRLGIKTRWTPSSAEWERTKQLVNTAKFQRALDKLEGLIVARLFELTKLNMSRTGAYYLQISLSIQTDYSNTNRLQTSEAHCSGPQVSIPGHSYRRRCLQRCCIAAGPSPTDLGGSS